VILKPIKAFPEAKHSRVKKRVDQLAVMTEPFSTGQWETSNKTVMANMLTGRMFCSIVRHYADA
jgi:hypothetical protein